MSVITTRKRNKHCNCRNGGSNLQFTTQLLLLLQLMFCCGCLWMDVAAAAELPAELMLEGVSLLKSMEYAQQQQQHQLHQQKHQHELLQHKQQQSAQQLHGQSKRFAFGTASNSDGTDMADMDGMQPPALSPGDISRFERELFLASAIDHADDDAALTDNVEQPLESDSMENVNLMEHAIDYKQQQQHQPTASMWLQQHNNNGAAVGDNKKTSNTFLKLHHPFQQQQQQHQHHNQKQHHKHLDTNPPATLAPPPSPVAEPQRHCSIEISTKLAGVCQSMPHMGAACVAGDYMDVYNQDCM